MKIVTIAAAVAGLTAVGLGAFGAHALRPQLLELNSVGIWETGSLYHLVHAVALLAAAVAAARAEGSSLRRWGWVAACWLVGIILFSGSLYSLALGGPKWLGPVTPLGGLSLMAGWILVAFAIRPQQR